MDRNEMKENMRRQLEDDNYLTFIARNSFNSVDKDKSGTIDVKELKTCMSNIAKGLKMPIPEDEVAKLEFSYLDKDNNSSIDFDEFKQFVKKYMLLMINNIPS